MVNSSNILENHYNLTSFLGGGVDVVSNPVSFAYYFNEALSGYFIISMLALSGLMLFFFVRGTGEGDIRSALYASFMMSFVGLLLFFVSVVPGSGLKLVAWIQLVPFFVITLLLILFDKLNSRY